MAESGFLLSAYDYPYQDEDDEIKKTLYSSHDIRDVASMAKLNKFPCLSFISLKNKTYFNQKQVFEIVKNELPILKASQALNNDLLKTIEQIADLVLHEGYQFLKFEPKK